MTQQLPHHPIIVASENGRQAAELAMEHLRQGGSALDAIELACRHVEDDLNEHSVGKSGLPNVLGQVQLDASIMDGRTLRTGAVAGVQGYGHVTTLARQVMEELPHVLLVGSGAERFAQEMGHTPDEQLTPEAQRRWRARFAEAGLSLDEANLRTQPAQLRRLTSQLTRPLNLTQALQDASADQKERPHDEGSDGLVTGTVNFLARDQAGNLASAVSTSGLGWKYPGRVGDSPIVGAGNYCDNRYGAVACTGMGELAIRVSTARSLILYLKMGMTLVEAGMEALRDLHYLQRGPEQYMNMVALTPQGEHAGFSDVPGRLYTFITGEMQQAALRERLVLPNRSGNGST